MAWNESDWVAFLGGKGSYSSYDPGDANPDQLIKIPAHHGDVGYMLWSMEEGKNSKTNNQFGIGELVQDSNLNHYDGRTGEYQSSETRRAKYKGSYGIGLW